MKQQMVKNNQYIFEVIQYIEAHLDENIDTEDLSKAVYRSCMQLHRDFYSVVGHTVKSYIAKRRLSVALAQIKTSDLSPADIAYLSGYSSQQALCRAVKQELGLTPLQYQKSNIYFDFQPYDGYPLYSVSVCDVQIPETFCVRFYHSCLRDLEQRAVNKLFEIVSDFHGRIWGRNGAQKGNRFCYELYLTDTNTHIISLLSHDFEIVDVRSSFQNLCAVVTVANEEAKINDAWDYLYKIWLGNSMFEPSGTPYFEEYLYRSLTPHKLKLYLPLRKRCGNAHIRLLNVPNMHFIAASGYGYNAEHAASQCIIDYLSEYSLYPVKLSRMFYFRKNGDNEYTCGVKISEPIRKEMINDPRIYGFSIGEQSYLVLESSVMGDYDRMAEYLLRFAKDNHFPVTDDIFALYDAERSYDTPKVQLYCGIKVLQNGNTSAMEHDIIMPSKDQEV